jgi:hypothetical protein
MPADCLAKSVAAEKEYEMSVITARKNEHATIEFLPDRSITWSGRG